MQKLSYKEVCEQIIKASKELGVTAYSIREGKTKDVKVSDCTFYKFVKVGTGKPIKGLQQSKPKPSTLLRMLSYFGLNYSYQYYYIIDGYLEQSYQNFCKYILERIEREYGSTKPRFVPIIDKHVLRDLKAHSRGVFTRSKRVKPKTIKKLLKAFKIGVKVKVYFFKDN